MIVYNNSKNENIKQFITEANPTKNQLIQFINKSIVKVFDTYYLSDEQNILSDKLYPFNEGDDYYTIENGDIIYSCWDDVSEEMHDENPNKKYFSNTNDAKNYLKAMKIISITTKKQIFFKYKRCKKLFKSYEDNINNN